MELSNANKSELLTNEMIDIEFDKINDLFVYYINKSVLESFEFDRNEQILIDGECLVMSHSFLSDYEQWDSDFVDSRSPSDFGEEILMKLKIYIDEWIDRIPDALDERYKKAKCLKLLKRGDYYRLDRYIKKVDENGGKYIKSYVSGKKIYYC